MMKFFFCILTLLVFSFSILSCRSSRQSGVPANASNAAAQNSKNEPSLAAGQAASEKESVEPKKPESADAEKKSSDDLRQTSADKFENRCGWFENPTPANAWLVDRDGEWIIGVQGGHQADGDWPEFADDQWIKTNVHYGYGCACLRVRVDYKTRKVLEIASATAKPLSACRKDPALKEPKE